ncbi:hypothetical protein [Salipiger mucosus]|uniref:Uncharacterized protein n=1 Tax=Salipiger mucosus DSM 16094 TaxID=1123237 RepID=S9S3H5_9RHOB|nr:hypothetical protein [Salipiger mucosus]EPX84750.1 hypothetical protein Salmuc_01323 [Salipiger mucosus DSM 16094]
MPCEITKVRYRQKKKEYEATLVEYDETGKERSRIVANSKSTRRLKEMLAPAKPTNLSRIDALLPAAAGAEQA